MSRIRPTSSAVCFCCCCRPLAAQHTLLQLTLFFEEAVMRRVLVLAVALVAVLGVLAPPAMAQAPAPKVTITGFIDEVFTYGKNLSDYDNNYNRQKDTQATGRTRGRFDIIGEVGKAKAVLGIELDAMYGQTGNNDTFLTPPSSLTAAAFQRARHHPP